MQSVQFAYWLQGFFELSESNTLTEKQVEMIKNHLKLVFYHEIDPSYSDNPEVLSHMQNIHDGKPVKPVRPNHRPPGSVIVKC